MHYKDYNNLKLSSLGMGAMRLPMHEDVEGTPIDFDKAEELIELCYEKGINYYDTAYIYHNGESEVFLGRALAKYPRESFYVADKFNAIANPDYKEQFSEQLRRLNMEYIDFYLLHGLQDQHIKETVESGCIEYFDGMKKKGKIRSLGFSFHGTPKGLRELMPLYKWDFVQIQLNYFDWFYGDAKELYEILEENNIPIIVMEPVRGGLLAALNDETCTALKREEPDKSIASWAMRWIMNLPQIAVVLSGMSNIEQVTDNLGTFSEYKALDEKQNIILREVIDKFRPSVSVACTACRYCCDDCPAGLDIPHILMIYNDVKMDNEWRLSFLSNLPKDKRPTACIGCGECKKHCPQSIDIPNLMSFLAEKM